MLIAQENTSLVLVMISSKFVPVCNRYARRANTYKITSFLIFWSNTFDALFREKSFHLAARNFVTEN